MKKIILETKLVGKIEGEFYIPSYQRGYRFNWDADEIELHYTHEGKVYHCSVLSLAILMGNPDLVLVPAVE